MLQKILNLFRRKKVVPFDERDNYVHDSSLFLQSRPFPSKVDIFDGNSTIGTGRLVFPDPKSSSSNGLTIEGIERTVIELSNPDFDAQPVYPFPSDSGPDWSSTIPDSCIDSNDISSSSDSGVDFGGGTSDGGGATGEY